MANRRLSTTVKLALAGLSVAGAVSAQTLNSGVDGTPGDLFLVVYDSTAKTTYFEDLGISTPSVVSNSSVVSNTTVANAGTVSTALSYSGSIALDSTLSTQLSTHSSDTYQWEVVAANNGGSANNQTGTTVPNYILTSAASAVPHTYNSSTGYNSTSVTSNSSSLGNDIDSWTNLSLAVNAQGKTYYGFANDSAAPGQSGDAGALTWYNIGGITPVKSITPSSSTTSSGNFYLVSATGNGSGNGLADIFNLGTVTLNAGSTDTLVFAGSSAGTVPLPAAVWLLASGLMGLAGVGRRRVSV